MAAFQSDLVIQNDEGDPIALVEVKNPSNLSRELAREMHRNIIRRGLPRRVPYLLLLSQDKGYLWENPDRESEEALPNYEFSMDRVVNRYRTEQMSRRLYTEVLEFLVFQWLMSLTNSEQESSEEPEKTLSLSGFNKSIKGATVLFGKVG